MPAWLSADLLAVIYLLLLGGGVLAATALALLTEAGDPWASAPFGSAGLVAGVTCFGGAGILALRLFGLTPGLSLLAAALFALLSVAMLFALALVARRVDDQRAALADLVGALAHVTTPIEPGDVGVIATDGARPSLTLPAISRHDQPLAPGAIVVVTGWRDNRAEVVPLLDEPEDGRRKTEVGRRKTEDGGRR